MDDAQAKAPPPTTRRLTVKISEDTYRLLGLAKLLDGRSLQSLAEEGLREIALRTRAKHTNGKTPS